jgi:hypothetical protein
LSNPVSGSSVWQPHGLGDHAAVEGEVVGGHTVGGEPLLGGLPALCPVDLADAVKCVDEVGLSAADEAGDAVVDDFGTAPHGVATTGVPQARAPIITTLNGSGHRPGLSRRTAARSSGSRGISPSRGPF